MGLVVFVAIWGFVALDIALVVRARRRAKRSRE
jgi:hypothetical protein